MASTPPPALQPHPAPPPALPELPEGATASGPRWPPWSAPVALLGGFAGAILGAIVVTTVALATGADVHPAPPAVQIADTVLQDAALIGAALLFARMVTRPRAWHFGLRPTPFWRAAGLLGAVWAAFFTFSAIWIALLHIHQRDELPKELGADRSTVALVAVGVLVTVVAPIAEEFFFRGYFFAALRRWHGPLLAAILTGLTFGAIHAGSAPAGFLVPLAVFGVGLCWLRELTGSLLPCIALHALNNSLAYGVTQGWGWQIPIVMVASNLVIAAILLPLVRGDAPGRDGRAGPGSSIPAR